MKMNMYQWETRMSKKFESYGDMGLSALLILAAIVILLIALFSRSVIFKSLVLAYVVLP